MLGVLMTGLLLQALPFAGGGWELTGDAVLERVDDRDAVRVSNGWAYRRDLRREEGALARDPAPGYIALRAFTPPGTPGDGPSARFADCRVVPGPPSIDVASLAASSIVEDPARVRAWRIAGPLTWTAGDTAPAVPDVARTASYRSVTADPSGLVELHRHVTMPAKSREVTAAARFRVTADPAGTRAFDLGFSDRATVCVNGRPVFPGEASYSYAGRREGLIDFDQARLYLPLEAGANEVLVMLSDGFGGMGIMGRFADAAGLVVEAR